MTMCSGPGVGTKIKKTLALCRLPCNGDQFLLGIQHQRPEVSESGSYIEHGSLVCLGFRMSASLWGDWICVGL